MNTKKLIAAVMSAGIAFGAVAEQLDYKLVPDSKTCVCNCGDKVTYTVTVTKTKGGGMPTKGGKVKATLDNFGKKTIASEVWDLGTTNVFTISGTLAEPGFLRLVVKGPGAPEKRRSVAFEPLKIVKGSPRPADFDEFWKSAIAKLEKEVPADVQMEKDEKLSCADFDFYNISLASFGRRVYGYMSVPTDRSKAPYPVEFSVNAAGFGDWTNSLRGQKDRICVQFSVYPFAMSHQWQKLGLKKKYDALNEQVKKAYGVNYYPQSGITLGRESYFYYPVILGINRAVDWVASRPDVDRKNFWYQGTSQGGGFGFYLCGLNRVFTRAVFYVPALTDTMGYLKDRQSGWPTLVERNSRTPESRAAAEKWAPYFDGANFASRIACPVRVVVGFSDTTCAPCAVYAAYNEIPSGVDKGIEHGLSMGHGVAGEFYSRLGDWLKTR